MTPTPHPYEQERSTSNVRWWEWPPGQRVVVRRKHPEGGLGDVLGYVTKMTEDGLEIDTRRGPVWVPAETIFLGKKVPPPPAKRERKKR